MNNFINILSLVRYMVNDLIIVNEKDFERKKKVIIEERVDKFQEDKLFSVGKEVEKEGE